MKKKAGNKDGYIPKKDVVMVSVSTCMACSSIYHWATACPHSYENAKKSKSPDVGEDNQCYIV